MIKKWAAVFFDLDGIVIDSEKRWPKVERIFTHRHHLSFDAEYERRLMSLSPLELAATLKKYYQLPETEKEIIKERDRLAKDIYAIKAKLLPGFLSLIKFLKRVGYRTALVTSSPYRWIDPVANRLELRQWFEKIISSDDLVDNLSKPHPAIYLLAAKKMGVEPEQCLVFEDSVNGVLSAKAAGMFCVAVPGSWVKDRRGLERAEVMAQRLNESRVKKLFI